MPRSAKSIPNTLAERNTDTFKVENKLPKIFKIKQR